MSGRNILTAAEMRAAEERAIASGTPVEELMERAGTAAAEAIRRFEGPAPALVLCGPGNNGGDGYVIARALSKSGIEVRVAALGEPRSGAALAARQRWRGPVEPLDQAHPAPLLVDALFGTGLARALDAPVAAQLMRLAAAARVKVAIDVPSGAATDDGALLSPVPDFDLTVTFATLKPSHLLQPAARHMGRIVVADIGVHANARLTEVARPALALPGPEDHKYSRGYVVVIAGDMPGATSLAAAAAARAGAGYVRLLRPWVMPGLPHAVVQSAGDIDAHLADARVGAVVVGPGLGRGEAARKLLDKALAGDRPLILDADALVLASPAALRKARHPPILTPHAGEFARLFGAIAGSKVEQARAAAALSGAVVLLKGADTVAAAPDGRAAIAPAASHFLASAGTGDVLAGICAAMRARGLDPFEAACAAAWIHGRAGERAGAYLLADDLLARLPAILSECQ